MAYTVSSGSTQLNCYNYRKTAYVCTSTTAVLLDLKKTVEGHLRMKIWYATLIWRADTVCYKLKTSCHLQRFLQVLRGF